MLAYTAFVIVRVSRRYFLARRESFGPFGDSASVSERGKKDLVADLSHGVGTLRSITFAAPFLGLAGTYYGMLCLFARGWLWSLALWYPIQISAALVATAAGLIVAIPAAVSHNVLRECLERLESSHSSTLLEATPRSYGFAQTLPLRRQFSGMPAFALIAAPLLGILLLLMVTLGPRISMGLPVHLLKIADGDHDLPPIIVRVTATKDPGRPLLYVNSKETSWDELGSTLRSQLEVRPRWIVYAKGADDVDWAYVADAIDVARGLHAEVVLLPATTNIESGQTRGAKTKRAKAR